MIAQEAEIGQSLTSSRSSSMESSSVTTPEEGEPRERPI